MHHRQFSVLSAFPAVLLANLAAPLAPLWGDVRVMHTWNSVPANWESLGSPPANTTIDLHFALKPEHENALIDTLYEVSSPGHQNYKAHLSKEQVAKLVTPHQHTLEIVHSWLEYHGVPSSSISTSHGGGWLSISGVLVTRADELLCASYQLYRHTGTDETKIILRTVSYALPAALHGHVETVAPTTHFASPRTPMQTPRKHSTEEAVAMVNVTSGKLVRVLSKRADYVTPSFLHWLYHTKAYVPAATDKNVLGILGFVNDGASRADLTQFMTNFREDAEAATFTVVEVNGGRYDPSHPGMGGNVNTQYAEAMAYPTPHVFYSSGGQLRWLPHGPPVSGDAYREVLNYLLNQLHIPPTIAMTYANLEQEFSPAYVKALCALFAQLGVRGVSVLVPSGDDGVGIGDCVTRRGIVRFTPMFPASCPWVTSVGGTTYHDPEIAAVFSGGGFSSDFVRPRYQDDSVRAFLKFFGPERYSRHYNRAGRGIPDIASQAQRFVYVRDSVLYETSGTICATSTAAGIVSLLNDYLFSKGEAPLGFLNNWLYEHGLQSLNDIVSGSNPGCETGGFPATSGWDPVTGLGTLDFEILQAVLDHEIDDEIGD